MMIVMMMMMTMVLIVEVIKIDYYLLVLYLEKCASDFLRLSCFI